MDAETLKHFRQAQRAEITEYHIYVKLARVVKDANNRAVLERIAADEKRHYESLRLQTGEDIKPNRLRIWWYTLISRVLGLSFGLRLMEHGEQFAEGLYLKLSEASAESAQMLRDEQRHEGELLGMIEEERIAYAGSMVLGLNDALVELTGALAGLTFALRDGRLIAVTGLITGVAASMSMAASEYLSSREDSDGGKDPDDGKSPAKSALYTGTAYIITVALLITPYLVLSNVYAALGSMLTLSVLVVFSYNYYIATAKGLPLWRRFFEMSAISLGVAIVSFGVGALVRYAFKIDV